MNDIELLEADQSGNIITRLYHNPVGERYFVRQWDIRQDEQTSDTPFSYEDVSGPTKEEAYASAIEGYRRLTSECR